MNRRAFLLAGTGAVTVAAVAPYAPLVLGDNFEGFVADTLGMDEAVASAILDRLRDRLGGTDYEERAVAFAIAFRGPWSGAVPEGLRRPALERFAGPLFSDPADRAAYVDNRPPAAPCGGLRRPS